MIHAHSQPAKYLVHFTDGDQVATSDTTLEKGGASRGFRPHALLEAALASCMNMTLRMAADKHAIPLSNVSVTVSLKRTNPSAPLFEYRVDFHHPLSEGQQQQLLAALETCPVRSTLSKPLDFRRVCNDRA